MWNPFSNLGLLVRGTNADLRSGGLNLCIAQKLRAVSPGAAGGEALLLSEEEQRQLIEIIRERAQIAMLNYALLGVVLANPRELRRARSQ